MNTVNILDILETSMQKSPEKIAYKDTEIILTYKALVQEAKAIGTCLSENGIYGKPVVVYMKKSPLCISAFMGCVYGRNFYVPVDTSMPKTRIDLIFTHLKPAAIIAEVGTENEIKEYKANIPVFLYEDISKTSIREVTLQSIRKQSLDTDPVYVLYTSGSTGIPKGVVVSQRSLIDYVEQFCSEVGITQEQMIANQAPFYFDASLIDIYCTMKAGATMCIVPLTLFSLPIKLLEFLEENEVTTIRWVPSALNIVSTFKALKNIKPSRLSKIIFGAEAMPTKCFNYWKQNYPEAVFVQIYGPTEITGVCTYYIVDREFENTQTIPIGKAFQNTEVFLLDEKNQLIHQTTPDVMGEICVKGSCLALGYYDDIERTQEAFVQNPLNNCYPEKIYRTGDLACYNEFEELVFISRKDFQIKHMGHRIELGEIEAAVNAVSGMKTACCLFDHKKSKIITCYTTKDETLEETEILVQLKDRLPRYMLPNLFYRLPEMPMTPSGKIDRVLLKETYITA